MPTYSTKSTSTGAHNTLHPFYVKWSTRVHYIVVVDSQGRVRGLPEHILNKELLKDVNALGPMMADDAGKALARLEEMEKSYDEIKAAYAEPSMMCVCCGVKELHLAVKESIPDTEVDFKAFPENFVADVKPKPYSNEKYFGNITKYKAEKFKEKDSFRIACEKAGLHWTTEWDTQGRLAKYMELKKL
mmetsp:Transcript_39422/g.76618  ORF Transcript_39422/g.76618 Transcript_39422/m.76618 type:complete len:188 (-) Transcript_39422:162-725(-)